MKSLPLALRMKRRAHRAVASAQDIIALEMYDTFPGAVIHGGTAIWRCYGGNRFSEDIDLYLPAVSGDEVERFARALAIRGLEEEKVRVTGRAVFARFSYGGAAVSFEAVAKRVSGAVARQFEMVDGTYIVVKTLTPERLVEEKMAAYASRRKARDLYDVFFLLGQVAERREVAASVARFLREFEPPADERELRALVISGSVPTVKQMVEAMRAWAR